MDRYSYYFENLCVEPYNFKDKNRCIRNYIDYMFLRTQKIFEYKGLPDTIPKRMLEFYLQINGFACITKVNGELYAFWGGLGGEPDEYYRPTICIVSNPWLKFEKTLKIDEDCVIVRNDSLLKGLTSLYNRYATAMTENDLSFRLATINTRIQSLLSAPDDPTKDSAEEYLRQVEAGDLGVVACNEFLEGIKAQPYSGSLKTFTDLIEYQQYLKASWFNEIGLNANYNMKREKLSTTESQMNNDALLPLVDDMLENRQRGIDKINEMFGTNITVEFSSSWAKLIEEFQSNQLDSEGVQGNGEEARPAEDLQFSEDDGADETGSVEVSSPDAGGEEIGQNEEAGEETGEVNDVEITVNVNVNTDDGSEVGEDDGTEDERTEDDSN